MIDHRDLGVGDRLVPYPEAWDLQREVHAAVSEGRSPSTVLWLEHEAVYTAGKRTEDHERPADGTPVIDVDRGGKITWHGPGQLVGYPIVRLPEQVRVVDFVRRLEEALIRTVNAYGLVSGRIGGWSGVWLPADDRGPDRKLGAIGIRVAAATTMHGFALNVSPDLVAYDRIVPCGLTDVAVSSLSAELGRSMSVAEVAAALRPHLDELLAFAPYTSSPDVAEPRPEPGTKRRVSYGLRASA